jgi:hypothetical protein
MHQAIVTIKSLSPYSPSRYHGIPRDNKETPGDHEARTWRERCHYTNGGGIFVPPMAFKGCLADGAKFKSVQIPGKGKATYTKHFKSGVLVTDGLPLNANKETVEGEWLFLNADGIRGSGKRVMKCYPKVEEWGGDVTFHILDDAITKDVFAEHIEESGSFIGIGRFRPQNGGYYGRFEVAGIKWE